MITILEGTDGVGKSSYARWLMVRTGGTILHYAKPDADPLEMYVARAGRWANDEHLICDRSFIGSAVWSRLGFHARTLTEEAWRWVCRWYASRTASAVFVVRPPAHVDEELLARGEDPGQRHYSHAGQAEFLRVVAYREVLYIPVAVVTSDLIHSTTNTEGNHH